MVAMLNENEAFRLRTTCEALPSPVEIILYQTGESDFGRKLADFVEEACSLSQGKIRNIAGRPDPGLTAYPCFTLGREGFATIIYAALPVGHQFRPFIKALELAGSNHLSAEGSHADLLVLISEHCPHCPVVVEAAIELSGQRSSIVPCILDAGQFENFTRQYGIKSVPATILDRRLVLTGIVSADRMMELVDIRGSLKFEREVVQSLIDSGRIAEAARCIDQGAGREVALDLIQSADFSKRLSGMVVIEKALEDKPDAVRSLVPSLVTMLSHADSRIRGDIADLLGRIGDPQAITQLEPLADDPDPDVAEAAAEAIAELRKQSGSSINQDPI